MSKLYVVGTPIGNLDDISPRALETLGSVDLILCEDTRVTKKLLTKYDISTRLQRLDAHTESSSMHRTKELFEKHEKIALVSDAGMPTVSDPGNRFIQTAREEGVAIAVIPGASAVTSALAISGLPASDFLFLGFLPHKKGRETLFKEIAESKRTVAFYESPHRILKTLDSLKEHLAGEEGSANRTVVVARELTKIYEEVVSGTPEHVSDYFNENEDKVRGEFVVMVSGLGQKQ